MFAGTMLGAGNLARAVLLLALATQWLPMDVGHAAPPANEFKDRPEPFVPRQAASEEDRNHLEALALFAAARTEEQRGNLPSALRLYQRAWRFDSQSVNIARQIVEVAQQLDRVNEAMRYAVRAVELDPTDARLAWSLADQLVAQGDFNNALKLYEQTRALQKDHQTVAYLTVTLQVGRLCFLTEHKERAADAFEELMTALEKPAEYKLTEGQRKALEGEASQNYELFAQAFLAADRPERALAAFERAERRKPSPALKALHRAQLFAQQKKPAEALEQLDAYFAADESFSDLGPLELLEEVLDDLGRAKDLIPRLERLLADEPGYTALKAFLARKYVAAKNYAAAQPLYEQLQKKTPTIDVYRGLIEVYVQTGQAERLVRLLGTALEKTNSLDSFLAELSKASERGPLLEQMAEVVRTLPGAEKPATIYHCRLAMAIVLVEAKRYPQADEFFELAIAAKPRSKDSWTMWGLSLLRADQYAAAATVLQRAIDAHVLAADDPGYHTYLAVALAMNGQTEAALKAAREAAEIGEHTASLESRIAWVYYHARQLTEAHRCYKELVDRFADEYKSDDTRRVVREARLTLSNICVMLNQMPEAEEWLEQVLDEYPEDISALNDLGYLWADQGKHLERALQMIRQAVAAEPENAAYRDSLGWALYRLGRFAEAATELERATGEGDTDGVMFEHLGDAYQAAGRAADAQKAWKRALESLKKQAEAEPGRDPTRDDKIRRVGGKLRQAGT
jgi:tetratricopeptide (TPR) repeat protein